MRKSLLRRGTRLAALTNYGLAIAAAVAGLLLIVGLLSSPVDEFSGQPVAFSALNDTDSRYDQQSALASLQLTQSRSLELSTNRSETPFWLLASPPSVDASEPWVVELPSRHIQALKYWIYGQNGEVLRSGSGSRSGELTTGLDRKRAGFAIELPTDTPILSVLLRIEASGPARLSVDLRKAAELDVAAQYFDRSGGVLFGSLLMIAAFSILISALSQDFIFFLFGAWVVSSLRLASYSTGWDLVWLGFPDAEGFPVLVRNIPLAAYAVFTVTLFWAIFRRDIVRIGATKYIRILLTLALALVLAGAVLPHRLFLPLLWAVVGPSALALIWFTVRIFAKTGSAAAAWYGASWLATLSGAVSEVVFAAGLTSSKPPLLSSLAGSVVSALLAGIAIALRLRSEKAARLTAQREKFDALEKFKQNYNSMPVGLFSMKRSGDVTLFNPAFATMFGLESEYPGAQVIQLGQLLGTEAYGQLLTASAQTGAADLELQVVDPQQGRRWFLARVTSKAESVEGSIQEITVRKEAESKLRHLVDHDSLTGLLNRHGLEEAMAVAADTVTRGSPCALAHVDLDRFKLVNELYGHAVGDAMLQEASSRLTRTVRTRDFVARIGDSFVVVFLDCPDQAAARLSERLRESIGEHAFDLLGKSLSMTVSIGVVSIEPDMKPVDALAAADRACSEAKARGRNCVVRLDDQDATLKTHLEELKVMADLRQRIPTDRYFLDFQPIVSLAAAFGSLNYEVLIRMRDEQGGIVQPGRFIGAAERNGLMSQIDRWVLQTTLEWIDSHPEHRERLTFATINFSGASLNDARFIDDAFSMIADHPHAMSKLCFEITESVALNDLDSTRRFVDRVRAYGSKLALDDFGAGYTSFNYLKEIPADFIKIDGSFVKDINRNPANYAITRTIVDLTHELGMRSIAEWAETPDTIASLIELGVDYGQGFGLARPMAKELVTDAASSAALVRDPQVIAMLESSNVQLLSAHRAASRRY
jgi:diguanylate cyclase (GGDEF)-like protein